MLVFRLLAFWGGLAVLSANTSAMTNDWVLWRDDLEVQVFQRTHSPSNQLEIRAETVVTTSLSAFVNLLHDTARAPNWINQVKSVKELKSLSKTDNLVETRFKGVWPSRERWVRTNSSFSQNMKSELTLSVTNQYLPNDSSEGIQIRQLKASWQLTPLQGGLVRIRYQGYADPGGHLPRWLVDSRSRSAIFKTFAALRRELVRPEYQFSPVDFIKEPAPQRNAGSSTVPAFKDQ